MINIFLIIFIIGINIADAVFTAYFINNGLAIEANPFWFGLPHISLFWLVAVKIFIVSLLAYVLYRFRNVKLIIGKSHFSTFTVGMIVCGIVYLAVLAKHISGFMEWGMKYVLMLYKIFAIVGLAWLIKNTIYDGAVGWRNGQFSKSDFMFLIFVFVSIAFVILFPLFIVTM